MFTPIAHQTDSLEQVVDNHVSILEAEAGATFDSYTKYMGQNAISSRSPVKVANSVKFDHNSTSKMTFLSKNHHILSGGRIKLLDSYAEELITS